MRRILAGAAIGIVALCSAWPALAGPPYVTDDPEPTESGHWEVYGFVNGLHVGGATEGATGLDINYGGAKDLQLTLALPLEYSREHGSTHLESGVVEVAAKLKVLHQDAGSGALDLALFPRLFVPTRDHHGEPDKLGLLLPAWAGKDFGPWSLFGGGGYQLNPGAGNRDFWTGGVALTRAVSDRFALGGEVYHRSADVVGGRPFTGVNLGLSYRMNDHWSVLASGGPGIQNARREGRYDFYLSLKADY